MHAIVSGGVLDVQPVSDFRSWATRLACVA